MIVYIQLCDNDDDEQRLHHSTGVQISPEH